MSDETQDHTKPQKRGRGRPSSFKPEYVDQIRQMCEDGLTDQEIADELGIERKTLWRWRRDHEELRLVLKVSKDAADDRVERSLFARATGYECEETDIRVVNGEIVKTQITKHYPPDTTAAIFWLKNRKRLEWRDRQEVEHTGKTGLSIEFVEPEKRDE